MEEIGIVIIGRNEGDRLRASLDSALTTKFTVVYIDSGSNDSSIQIARAKNIPTLELQNNEPFTAARARNSGFKFIKELYPNIKYVQFLDGDCQLIEGWIPQGVSYLKKHWEIAIVTGDLHEMEAKETIYNNLCELEWRKDPGEIKACGGNFLIKSEPFQKLGGFKSNIIAAEEEEFCSRLRREGWKIYHLCHPMAIHNASMHHISEWFHRSVRTGYAFAQSLYENIEPHTKEYYSTLFWGLLFPIGVVLCWYVYGSHALDLLFLYPVLAFKIYWKKRKTWTERESIIYSIFCVIGKFPNVIGLLKYHLDRLRGKFRGTMDYKGSL